MAYIKAKGQEDAFGKFIADSTSNKASLGGQYPYTPERWRLFSGTTATEANRIFLQYNPSSSKYRHQLLNQTGEFDVHQIVPDSGENLVFQTTEKYRYIVQYVSLVTFSVSISESLDSFDDTVIIGLLDDDNGYGIEFIDDNTATIFMRREGSIVASETVALERPITDFTRFSIEFNWYNVGNAIFTQTYTENGEQINKEIGRISVDGSGRGPAQVNLPIRYRVEADSARTGNTFFMNAGSSAYVILGANTPITRSKVAPIRVTIGTANTWVPIAAIRADPTRDVINSQLTSFTIATYDGTGQVEVIAQSVSQSNTDATGFTTPVEQSEVNSVVQSTTNVSTFPDSTGAIVSSGANPGGYQIGFNWFISEGGQGNTTPTRRGEQRIAIPRNIPSNDVILFLANAESTGDMTILYQVQQEI